MPVDVHPEDVLGKRLGFLGALRDLDPAGLATTTGLDLGLNDGHAAGLGAYLCCRRLGLRGRCCDLSVKNRHTMGLEEVARLEFV